MGFLSETTIIAGSSAYNLAGNTISRGNFMKNTILNLVVSGNPELGRGIVRAHMNGPATKYMRFAKWAESSGFNNQVGNYDGMLYSSVLATTPGFDFLVPPLPGFERRLINFMVDTVNVQIIGQSWILRNRPEYAGDNFIVTEELNGIPGPYVNVVPTGRLLITYSNGGNDAFIPPFDLGNPVLYGYMYYQYKPIDTGSSDDSGWEPSATQPSTAGYTGTLNSTSQSVSGVRTVRTLVEYSKGQPSTDDTVDSAYTVAYNMQAGTFKRIDIVQASSTVVGTTTEYTRTVETTYVLGSTTTTTVQNTQMSDGVTRKTTTTTTTPVVEIAWRSRTTSTSTREEQWLPMQINIYQQGTSAYGDAVVFSSSSINRKYFPVIPLRRFNAMVDAANYPEQYEWNKKASRKAFSSRKQYDKLLKSLADNPDLGSIDHAWVVFGVALGTQQQDGLTYLYEFFKSMVVNTPADPKITRSWKTYQRAWDVVVGELQISSLNEAPPQNSVLPFAPTVQQYSFNVRATQGVLDWQYNMNISGKGGDRITGLGMNPRAGGKVNNCWAYNKGSITVTVSVYVPASDGDTAIRYDTSTTTIVAFGKQLSKGLWEEYEFFDLVHTNNVFEGKIVQTLAFNAITNKDENSGFIVPLHEGVFKESTLVRRTQLSLEASFLVLNYYDKKKTPWYASGFFKIILVIAIIVIAVNTGYIDATSGGLLGTNAALGTALGYAGTAATVAGAIANALAAAIVAAVISKAAGSIFGNTWGRIIGAIVSMVVINLASTGTFSLGDEWLKLTKADNLIKLSMSGLQEYGNFIQAKAVDINNETQKLMAEYKAQTDEVNKLMTELMAGSGINAEMVAESIRYASESQEQFLARTLMTGTEVAETSIKLIEDFPAAQLKLPYTD